ncbi:MAG: GNAT family N-acetyltransferase [Blastocatellia bacterium]|nr:GNAT family N-acetyltransferase [Blastocatellia bacterium]
MEIKILTAEDAEFIERVAPDVFDNELDAARAREFIRDPRHHLVVAVDEGAIVGFVSAVHYVHPDKPVPELWLNEVGVASTHQRRGLGRAMIDAALEHGRRLGCRQAWVLTERTNAAAMGLYASTGGEEFASETVMFTYHLQEGDDDDD